MSLLGFQRALAGLAASPARCVQAMADPAAALEPYDLTDREKTRLATMAKDRLMATNCVLYRANRVTPIYIFFPIVCRLLGPDLRRELDAFWQVHDRADLQYLSEITRFARFLQGRLESGAIRNEYLREIVEYEVAATELRFADRASDSLTRVVLFSHDPLPLLSALSQRSEPGTLASGEYWVVLDGRKDPVEIGIHGGR